MRLVAGPADNGKRLDLFLSEKTGLTRSQIKKLLEAGDVLSNGKKPKAGERLRPGGNVEIHIPERPAGEALIPEPIPIEILYRDDHLIVVNKPAGLVVYPAAGHPSGTLMNAIAFHSKKLASIGGPLRAGVVHRLDKDTSGVIVVALDDNAYYGLLEQFRQRTIKRLYHALVSGAPREDEGVIERRIGRSESDRKKMSVRTRHGREAVTRWRVLERFDGKASLIEARLGTGRTHQIRVHFSSVGHPVLGDRVYGKKTYMEIDGKKVHIPRQMLHAKSLEFIHPASGEEMFFESSLPGDMKEVISVLRNRGQRD